MQGKICGKPLVDMEVGELGDFFFQKETRVERKIGLLRIKFHEILSAFSKDALIIGRPGNIKCTMVGWRERTKGGGN